MLFSQNQADSLFLKRNVLNEWRFCQNGKTLSFNESKTTMRKQSPYKRA
jgi:hypothetical protein